MKKNNANIMSGLFGDRDKRTKRGIATLRTFFIACVLLIVGIVMFVTENNKYETFLANNTTQAGVRLDFTRTNAELKISSVWTDKEKDVTIVKLYYDNNAHKKLSSKGTNYNLYMYTGKKPKPKNITMSYGILGNDGDGFLIIKGKLEPQAYQIFIANQLELVTDFEKESDSTFNDNKSIENALSEYAMDSVNDDGVLSLDNNKKVSKVDNINFRVNPYSESTKVYDGSFLNNDGMLDYSKIVEVTSVDTIIKDIEKSEKEINERIEKLEISKKEFEERLKEDENDKSSQSHIESIDKSLEEENRLLEEKESTKEKYKTFDFDESSFGTMQTKFKFL